MSGTADTQFVRRATRRKGRDRDRGQAPRQKVQYTALDPAVRAPRHGWMTVAGKEFADLLLSWRFMILIGILAIAAGYAVYSTAGQLRQPGIAEQASKVPSLFLVLFTPPSSIAPQYGLSFIAYFALLGPLLGIMLGFDAIAGERSEGTLPRLLSQPIHRDDVVNGKFVGALAVVGVGFAAIMLLFAAVGIIQLGITPDVESILRLAAWWLVAIIYVGFWIAFALLCSVVIRSSAGSALASIAVWLLLTLFAAFFVGIAASILAPGGAGAGQAAQIANVNMQENLARLSPSTLFSEATQAILDPSTRTLSAVTQFFELNQPTGAIPTLLSFEQSLLVTWPQVVSLVALTVVSFAAAYISFMRQEVRA